MVLGAAWEVYNSGSRSEVAPVLESVALGGGEGVAGVPRTGSSGQFAQLVAEVGQD